MKYSRDEHWEFLNAVYRHGESRLLVELPESIIDATIACIDSALDASSNRRWLQFAVRTPAERSEVDRALAATARLMSDARIDAWWFMRKAPGLRVRWRGDQRFRPDLEAKRSSDIDSNTLSVLSAGVFEPELLRFGGPSGAQVVESAFSASSQLWADVCGKGGSDYSRVVLCVALFSSLFRGAGLDRGESADVWLRVLKQRVPYPGVPEACIAPQTINRLRWRVDDMQQSSIAAALSAFGSAGASLASFDTRGDLLFGIREVLSWVVMFAMNQAGISVPTQAGLARAAIEALIGEAPVDL